jgi:superfamily II DNA or RNA helicase
MDRNELSDEDSQATARAGLFPIDPSFLSIEKREQLVSFSVDYWQAQALATRLHQEFNTSLEKKDLVGMRSRFYALIDYYEQTMRSLQKALKEKNVVGIVSTLRSLIALNTPLTDMYRTAPNVIPLPLTIDPMLRKRVIKDLIISCLEDPRRPFSTTELTDYINRYQFIQETGTANIKRLVSELVSNGYIMQEGRLYSRTTRPYKSTNFDDASLKAFLGNDLYQEFERQGFPGISNIINRRDAFQSFFERLTGAGHIVSDLFTASLVEMSGTQKPKMSSWHYNDLIASLAPRPYQRDAFAIFKGHGYQGLVIEAPTGSGKTLIGMMAMQDWLGSMSSGEAILVLVPTVNYEQQWVRELCYKDIGLQLSPDSVFSGPPAGYIAERKKAGFSPPILVMTYTSLAQLGSPKGKGGFDQISLEKFLQGSNIRYVILDEVHKVVEKLGSVSAEVTKVLIDWLRDGSLEGLIGFSGTAEAYRTNFDELGLDLGYIMPYADLIAYGFVAPFAEFGIPFAHSDRERRVLQLLTEYKHQLLSYCELLGGRKLRAIFASIPMNQRVLIGRKILDMYYGRKDRNRAISRRFREWERGEEIQLGEISLVTIIQIVNNLSDESLLWKAISDIPTNERTIKASQFDKIRHSLDAIRTELQSLVFYSDIVPKLSFKNFGDYLNSDALDELLASTEARMVIKAKSHDLLATSFLGLFASLRSIYYRLGEGLVESINSVLAAERRVRKTSGVVVFGAGKRIDWEYGVANPGYAGVAGIFSQMLGQRGLTPMAVLSSEIYLPWSDANPLPIRISNFIKQAVMTDELGKSFYSLLTQGIEISNHHANTLQKSIVSSLKAFVDEHGIIAMPKPKAFNEGVLQKIQQKIRDMKIGEDDHLVSRLNLKNSHLIKWMRSFFDYGIIAGRFARASTAVLQQADGRQHRFFVIKMDQGERKQLMYDLAARIMDTKSLSINVVVVSSWARTGWNVITPNILVDATATRNVTAWQQLRGRTMRALPTWDKACYESMILLLGPIPEENTSAKSKRVGEKDSDNSIVPTELDESSKLLLLQVHEEVRKRSLENEARGNHEKDLTKQIKSGKIENLSESERLQLAIDLMTNRNKVTHIYEMVKAYGTSSQIRYDRRKSIWKRKQNIATKHSHSYSVNPVSGLCSKGEEHSPLIYLGDPREYSPTKMKLHLSKVIQSCDPVIIAGWIRSVISG